MQILCIFTKRLRRGFFVALNKIRLYNDLLFGTQNLIRYNLTNILSVAHKINEDFVILEYFPPYSSIPSLFLRGAQCLAVCCLLDRLGRKFCFSLMNYFQNFLPQLFLI